MADPSDHLTDADLLPSGHGDAARRQVRIERVGPRGCHDHVAAGKPGRIQPRRANPTVVFTANQDLYQVEPLALGHAVHGLDNHAVEGGMTGCPQP